MKTYVMLVRDAKGQRPVLRCWTGSKEKLQKGSKALAGKFGSKYRIVGLEKRAEIRRAARSLGFSPNKEGIYTIRDA